MASPPKRTKTDEVLLAMLRENTGRHFLDSGDGYGRHHERNQSRDLEGEPASVLSFKYGEISVTHSVFHWLRDRLEIDEEADDAFHGPFRDECDPDGDKSWAELREDFPAWFARWRSRGDSASGCDACDDRDKGCSACSGHGIAPTDEGLYQATGIYGDGKPITVNSYNEENLLDQVILFAYFELRSGTGRGGRIASYVVLQIHGGCDVRGGYTRPRVFVIDVDDELAIFDFRRATIFCSGDEAHWWSTDDGHHWYGGAHAAAVLELNSTPTRSCRPMTTGQSFACWLRRKGSVPCAVVACGRAHDDPHPGPTGSNGALLCARSHRSLREPGGSRWPQA